jgi:hypothetical protein
VKSEVSATCPDSGEQKIKVKVKLSLCITKHRAMKTYRGVEVQLHPFLNSAVDRGPQPLYLRAKSPRYPLDRRLAGPQSRSERSGEERKSQHCPYREVNPHRPARSIVSILSYCP